MDRAETDGLSRRAAFDRKVDLLVGRTVHTIEYWDVHNFGPEPSRWDYGDWHHAVMGVQLGTDHGPMTITWTNTFYPYGVEVFDEPIESSLVLGDGGPECIGPDDLGQWASNIGTPIRNVAVSWEGLNLGPAQLSDGTVVEAARSVEVPIALRLDFDAGPVWFVAAIPQAPEMKSVFIPGDEIVVVFTREKLLDLGIEDSALSN